MVYIARQHKYSKVDPFETKIKKKKKIKNTNNQKKKIERKI